MRLVFATNNRHKLSELQHIVGERAKLFGLEDIGCTEEIPETEATLEGNAALKARYVFRRYGYPCFADDTGLEVDALGGRPGVYSARYGGESKDSVRNVDRLLDELKDTEDRTARFRTVICLVTDGTELIFEGIVNGRITRERHGNGGFGYDPVFVPDGSMKTFAEMDMEEKNNLSHRGRAVSKLVAWLRKHPVRPLPESIAGPGGDVPDE